MLGGREKEGQAAVTYRLYSCYKGERGSFWPAPEVINVEVPNTLAACRSMFVSFGR
jgi:hypothetical protein